MKLLPKKTREKLALLKTKIAAKKTEKAKRPHKKLAKKALRSASPYQFAIADTIDSLNPALWDVAAKQAGLFMSRSYLQAIETALPDNIRHCYALILQEGQVCAAVLMQIVELRIKDMQKDPDPEANPAQKALAKASKNLTSRLKQKVLVCGNLLNFGFHGIAFAEGIEPFDAWHGIADLLYRVRRSHKLEGNTNFVLIKDILDEQLAGAKRLELLNYRYVETEPNMVLALNPAWKTYDDYTSSLASKYRSSLRNQVFKPMDAAGCSVELLNETDIIANQERIHDLYLQVQANASVRPFELPEHYFTTLAQALGERLRFTVIKQAEVMIGFLITVADGKTAIAYHIGFDREATKDLPIYLRLLHASIADAISLGCESISFGRTALDPKASLGAKPVSFGLMMRHSQPVINTLIKRLILGIEHDDAPERNPFKKAEAAV